jgi:hypothetical protein
MYKRTAEQIRNAKAAPRLIRECRKTMTWKEIGVACGVCKLSPQLWAKGRAPDAVAFKKLEALARKCAQQRLLKKSVSE